MLTTIASDALALITGGADGPSGKTTAVRNCRGGALVVQDEKKQLWAHSNGLFPQRLQAGLTADQFCGDK